MENYKYIFGPVLSRRLGLSLGIDLMPYKNCSLDCIYCEAGKTTFITDEIKEYVPTDEVIKELDEFLSIKPTLDYITFSGNGEPTLHSGIGKIIDFLKSNYAEYKIAILTNGTLFTSKEVQNRILKADIVKISLDAVSEKNFLAINHPHKNLKIEAIIESLIAFRKIYFGNFYLEIFIIPGINDTPEELKLLIDAIKKISPDKIQINSLDRPPAYDFVKKADFNTINFILNFFKTKINIPVEFIGKYKNCPINFNIATNIETLIINNLKRRPMTFEELEILLKSDEKKVEEILFDLLKEKKITIKTIENKEFYTINN